MERTGALAPFPTHPMSLWVRCELVAIEPKSWILLVVTKAVAISRFCRSAQRAYLSAGDDGKMINS